MGNFTGFIPKCGQGWIGQNISRVPAWDLVNYSRDRNQPRGFWLDTESYYSCEYKSEAPKRCSLHEELNSCSCISCFIYFFSCSMAQVMWASWIILLWSLTSWLSIFSHNGTTTSSIPPDFDQWLLKSSNCVWALFMSYNSSSEMWLNWCSKTSIGYLQPVTFSRCLEHSMPPSSIKCTFMEQFCIFFTCVNFIHKDVIIYGTCICSVFLGNHNRI